MNNSIVINNQSMLIKQYNGQRVLTFKDIDIAHGRPEGTARRNFNSNKSHFIEGEDYYKIQPNEIRTVGIKSPNGGIVLNESGYLMLAKSFTDDLAWKVQRELVNSYFKVKQSELPVPDSYTYSDKTYNGELVLTTEDIAHLLNLNRATVSDIVRKNLTINKDYYFLQNEKLMWFKSLNPQISRTIRWIMIVTKKGFDKLCEIYGVEVEKPECLTIKPKPYYATDMLERICKDNNITAIPLNDEIRRMMCNMFKMNKFEPEYAVELKGEKFIMYDENATGIRKQYLIAVGIAQFMNLGGTPTITPEKIFASVKH